MPDVEPNLQTGEFYFGTFGDFSIGIDNRPAPDTGHGRASSRSASTSYRA